MTGALTNEFNAPPQILLSDLSDKRRVNYVKGKSGYLSRAGQTIDVVEP